MKDAVRLARSITSVSLAGAVLALMVPAVPALSQDTLAESRLRKMEAEIRAIQRTVFPGGDGRFFEPEITPPEPAASSSASQRPATSAVTDLLIRMDTLESQIARLTEQIEQNSNRISQLETSAVAAEPAATPAASEDSADAPAEESATSAPGPAPQANLDAMTGGASKPAAAAASAPSSDPVSAVSAITKPQTEDPADDEYTYGFRLWDAKFYPEAQRQLKMFLDQHPTHWRATWGRNLLGRAYLEDGNPREAAKWFLQNYQADKSGARAPDSLLYLAATMKQLDDATRACIALAEFSETYAAEAAGRLKGLYDATGDGLDCGG